MDNASRILCVLFLLTSGCVQDQSRGVGEERSAQVMPDVASNNTGTGLRIALVIGNGNYKYTDSLPKLANPVHDANDVSAELKKLGFAVITGRDMSREEMNDAIARLGREGKGAEAIMFYYSGHGVQSKSQNYLMPVDAKIGSAAQVTDQGINVNYLLDELDNTGSANNIVVLDACRNNPSGAFRGAGERGLAVPSNSSKDTVIVYSTEPGNTAEDGTGRNGTYTEGFLVALREHSNLGTVIKAATKYVYDKTGHRQTPFRSGSSVVEDRFNFSGKQEIADTANDRPPQPVYVPSQPAPVVIAASPEPTAPKPSHFAKPSAGAKRYIVNEDGTATDRATMLRWKRCPEGQQWVKGSCVGEVRLYSWTGFTPPSGWRLPTREELDGLLYCDNTGEFGKECSGIFQTPAISMDVFPIFGYTTFWSSSSVVGNPYCSWFVDYGKGSHDWIYRTNKHAVRLVQAN